MSSTNSTPFVSHCSVFCQLPRDFSGLYWQTLAVPWAGAAAAQHWLHGLGQETGLTWVLTCSAAERDFLSTLILCSWSAPGKMKWYPRHRKLTQCTLKSTLQSVCAGNSEHTGIEHLPGSMRPFLQSSFSSLALCSSSYTTFPPPQHLFHFENSLFYFSKIPGINTLYHSPTKNLSILEK